MATSRNLAGSEWGFSRAWKGCPCSSMPACLGWMEAGWGTRAELGVEPIKGLVFQRAQQGWGQPASSRVVTQVAG